MITIFHGENVAQSRNAFTSFKQSQKSPVTLAGSTVTLTELMQTVEGSGLFENDISVFIEELFSKRKQSNELNNLVSYIAGQNSASITLWESKELTKKQLQQFDNAAIKQFPLPKSLFFFLDSLSPGKGKIAVKLFHETLKTEEAEFVFFMIVRQIRILLGIKDSQEDAIDEIKRLQQWQKTKLQKQAQAFGKEKLLDLYDRLFEIEKGSKTGTLTMPLENIIDFWLPEI